MNTKTVLGWLQIVLAAIAAAAGSGLIHLDPQVNDVLLTVVAGLAGGHALKSGSEK